MWTSEINSDSIFHPFNSSLDKDIISKGGFQIDFEAISGGYPSLIKCPYIKASMVMNQTDQEKVLLLNANIDLSNWRCMLLAMCCVNSKVRELYVHGCQLTARHIGDLALALTKSGFVRTVTIQFCDFQSADDSGAQLSESLKELLGDGAQIEKLSLKGNKLGDSIIEPIVSALSNNFKLKLLNLSQNNLSQGTFILILQSIRYNSTLQGIDFSCNHLMDGNFGYLISLFGGSPAEANDESSIKGLLKVIADKNKAIKDLNKKRKKSGYPDLEEIPSPPEFLKPSPSNSKQFLFSNRTMQIIDLAENPISGAVISEIAELIKQSFTPECLLQLYFGERKDLTENERLSIESTSTNLIII